MTTSPPLVTASAPLAPPRRLHVIERGAPLLDPESASSFEQTVTLAQPRDERPAEFGIRVLDRIAWAERMGRPFDAAALSATASTEVAVLAARRLMALGIRAHGATTGRLTRLLLVAAPHCGAPAKEALLELADELLHAAGERPSVVSVRFGAARARNTP